MEESGGNQNQVSALQKIKDNIEILVLLNSREELQANIVTIGSIQDRKTHRMDCERID